MPYLPTFQDEQEFDLEPIEKAIQGGVGLESSDEKLRIAVRALRQMRERISNIIETLENGLDDSSSRTMFSTDVVSGDVGGGRVVEGVFDGEKMLGTDGMKYLVPPNYASKSKLVEGDIMKLTIKDDGSFVYKQISPVERERVTGKIGIDEKGNYGAETPDGKVYKILTASVTYFKGDVGDEIVVLIPKGRKCAWAAVEHILKG